MSDKYKMKEAEMAYFMTLTVVDWVDIFIRKNHKLKLLESLIYCQNNKGLEIYGWCLMSSHLHLIARATGSQSLSEIIRDFKKYLAKEIIKQIEEETESRRTWILARFQYNGKYLKRVEKYKFWQDGNHAEMIYSNKFFYEKLEYIYNNPVKELIVQHPEDYYFSSARNYAGLDFLLPVVLETAKLITY